MSIQKLSGFKIFVFISLIILILAFTSGLVFSKVISNTDNDIDNSEELETAIDYNPAEAAKLLESIEEDEQKNILVNINDILKNALPVKNTAFQPGEEIEFSVKYGIISVGSAVFKVAKSVPIFERGILMITSDARTNSFFDTVYRVRDRIVSYVDSEKLFSYKYIKVQREGGKKINELIRYNYPQKTALRYRSRLKKNTITHNKAEFELESSIFDPFAALYYLRNINFKVGDTIRIPVSSSTELYELGIKVIKLESLKTKIGKIDCFRVRPLLLKEGIFIHKGDMDIWFTADHRKIPVKMKGEMLFGSINATIEKYREK